MSDVEIKIYATRTDQKRLVDLIHYSLDSTIIIEGYINDFKLIAETPLPWKVEVIDQMDRKEFDGYLKRSTFLGDTTEEIITTLKVVEAKHFLEQ